MAPGRAASVGHSSLVIDPAMSLASPETPLPVAIVGGGVTGLTAAFRLWQRGVPSVVYESGPRLGGPVHTTERDGYLAEDGPNTLLETSPKLRQLIDDVEIGRAHV